MESQQPSERIRVLVAVRNETQRHALASRLSRFDDVAVVGRSADGRQALIEMRRTPVDLVFLDRGMLTLGELRSVRKVLERGRPLIAFVMTRPQPIDVFEPNAVDYLRLPTTIQRTRTTVERAKERLDAIESPSAAHTGGAAFDTRGAEQTPQFLQHLPIRSGGRFHIIPVQDLVSAVSHAEYLHLTTRDGERHIIVHRLKDLEAKLDPASFVRLSRSTVVNVSFVRHLVPGPNNVLRVALSNGDEHATSRRRARQLREGLLRL
jgi:DNA-binding LytR/AlgR family response regulator